MSELLGLIESLESHIVEASKIPMTGKIILEESLLLGVLDKLKIVARSEVAVRMAVDVKLSSEAATKKRVQEEIESVGIGDAMVSDTQLETEIQATQKAIKIKEGANDYADYILANLQLTLTKMQKNLIHLEKNIDSGRQILSKQKQNVIEKGV
jgi:hypothetical protein